MLGMYLDSAYCLLYTIKGQLEIHSAIRFVAFSWKDGIGPPRRFGAKNEEEMRAGHFPANFLTNYLSFIAI